MSRSSGRRSALMSAPARSESSSPGDELVVADRRGAAPPAPAELAWSIAQRARLATRGEAGISLSTGLGVIHRTAVGARAGGPVAPSVAACCRSRSTPVTAVTPRWLGRGWPRFPGRPGDRPARPPMWGPGPPAYPPPPAGLARGPAHLR